MNPLRSFIASNILVVVAVVGCVYLGVSTVQVIARNWELQQEIATLRSEVAVLAAENERLTYDIEYYKTNEFLEQATRQKLNLKAPGETVTIVGDTNQTKNVVGVETVETREDDAKKSNWQTWIDFLMARD